MSTEIAQAVAAKALETQEKPAESSGEMSDDLLQNHNESVAESNQDGGIDSKKLAMIAKREKALMDSKKAWETEKAELTARLKALEEESGGYKSKVDAIKNKEWDKVNDLLDFEDLTQFKINGEQPTHESILEKKLADIEKKFESRLKEKDEELSKRDQERMEMSKKAAIDQFKGNIKKELDTDFSAEDPKFQWLSVQEDPQDLVYGIIEEYYNATEAKGKAIALTIEQASEMAEKYLEEEAEKKFGKVKKAKTLIEKLFPTEGGKGEAKAVTQGFSQKTLTNSNTAGKPASEGHKASLSWKDLEESRSEAAKLLRFV
jgi:hypothetical protein